MDIAAWILSGVLAAAFVGAGVAKLLTPRERMLQNPNLAWAEDFSAGQVKGIGTLELLGGIGVILPWLLDIARVLTPLAAVGLGAIMIGAMATHRRRGELRQALPVNGVLLAIAVTVAALRFSQL